MQNIQNYKSIAVIGGEGFIGNALLKELVKIADINTRIYSIDVQLDYPNLRPEVEGVVYINPQKLQGYGNTLDSSTFDSAISLYKAQNGEYLKFDLIFHFGEYSRVVPSFKYPARRRIFELDSRNLAGIIEYCLLNGTKLVYSGSSTRFTHSGIVSEDEITKAPYVFSKSRNIDLIKAYHKWFKLDYLITYFYNAYGEGQVKTGEFATVIGIWEDQYKHNLPLTVRGDGSMERDFTHVDDIVKGIIASVNDPRQDHHEFKLAKCEPVNLLSVARLFEGAAIEFVPEVEGERRFSWVPEPDELPTGWEATNELEDYIAQIVHAKSIENNHN